LSPTSKKELEKISIEEACLKCKLPGQKAVSLVGFLKIFHMTHETSFFMFWWQHRKYKALMRFADSAVLGEIRGRLG